MSLVWGSQLLSRHLDTVGDGSGEKNATGDYSSEPTAFRIENYNEEMDMVVGSFVLYVQGDSEFLPKNYGGIPELANGVKISIKRVDDETDLTNGKPIVHTCCLARLFTNVQYNLGDWEPGIPMEENWISAEWDFKRFGTPLILRCGDSFEVELEDDFEGLIAHRFMVFGFWAYPRAAAVSYKIF